MLQLFTLGMNVSVILANTRYGWNRHLWEVEVSMSVLRFLKYIAVADSCRRYQNAGIVAFCSKLLFVQAATFTRISLILFYYRLVRDSGIQWFTYVLHASMAFVVGLDISFTCVGIWLCSYAFCLIQSSHYTDRLLDLSRLTGRSLQLSAANV